MARKVRTNLSGAQFQFMEDGWLDAVQILGIKQLCAAFEPISDFDPLYACVRPERTAKHRRIR
jgi:hypothetical protein